MPTHVPTRLRDESGFLLVEVLVSAMLLVVASLAIMQALDRSDALAGNQQKRTIAANVAQAELERIRSLPIEDVANLRKGASGRRTESMNGTNFTVNSDARWLTDGKDTVDCTASNGGLDYLKVTTEVSWPGMATARPASLTTIVTPSNRSTSDGNGSLSVSIVNAAGAGIANLPVRLTGTPATYTDNTDAQGCVAWGDLDASDPWQLEFGIAGYVDANGNATIDDNIALAGGTTTVRQYQYDRAGNVEARFRTRVATNGPDITVDAEDIAIANAQMATTKFRSFTLDDTWNSGTASPLMPLFPFQASPYSVYAGSCAAAMPVPASTNPQAPAYVNVTGGQTQPFIVSLPALKIGVTYQGVAVPGAAVKVTDACGKSYNRETSGIPLLLGSVPAEQSGFPFFASGTVCASYQPPSGSRRKFTVTTSNTVFNGGRTVNVPITNTSQTGAC